jgi:PAS domain S-box-containing protein
LENLGVSMKDSKPIPSNSEDATVSEEPTICPQFELHLAISKPVLSEDAFRHIFQSASDAMVITDYQGRIVRINTQTEILFGYQEQELVGQNVEILVPLAYRHAHVQSRAHYIENPCHRPMGAGLDVIGLRKDGTSVPLEVSLNPLQTECHRLVVSNIRDISERKLAEKMRKDLAFETTLAQLSAAFINLPPERIDNEITAGMRLLGEAMDSDRGSLGQLDETGALLATHSWARPGFPPFPDRMIVNTLPWLEERIRRGEISFTECP